MRANARRHGLVLIALLASYAGVFALGFSWSEQGYFHRYFDQVSYRYEAAKVAVSFDDLGVAGGLAASWAHATAQGFVYPLAGGIAYHLGIDPTHAVFALFLSSLAIVWIAWSDRGRVPWLGWCALALLTACTTLLNKVGGALDFRTDFLGQAGWSTACALALRSGASASRGWSIAAAAVFGLLFCTRSITLTYAVAGLPMWGIAAWFGAPKDNPGRRQRLGNLAIALALAGLLAAPFFVSHFAMIWDYYVANHISAKENAARGYHGSFGRYFPAYLRKLHSDHIGWPATALMLACLWRTWRDGSLSALRQYWPLVLVTTGFAMPLVVLSMGPQFSATVPGIAVSAAVWLPLLPWLARGRLDPGRTIRLVVAGALLLWPGRFLYVCYRDGSERHAAGHHLVSEQHRAILDHTRGEHDVVVSTLPLIEAHSLAMLELAGYELEHHLPDRFGYGLGHSIYACDSEAEFRRRLRASRVVLWWDGGSSGGDLPANREARERRALIARIVARDFEPASGAAREIELDGFPLRLYFHR